MADRNRDCPPPLRIRSGRGSLRSALIAGKLVRKSSRPIKVARFALACRRSLLTGPTAAAQPYQRERIFRAQSRPRPDPIVAIGRADKRLFVHDEDAETHKSKSIGLNRKTRFKIQVL